MAKPFCLNTGWKECVKLMHQDHPCFSSEELINFSGANSHESCVKRENDGSAKTEATCHRYDDDNEEWYVQPDRCIHPPVDCQGDWGAWSECDKSCGIGKKSRAYKVSVPAQNGGKACPYQDGKTETQDCMTKPCPAIDCKGDWSEWDECSKSCGTGEHSRTYYVKVAAQNGGTACPFDDKHVQTEACINKQCPFVLMQPAEQKGSYISREKEYDNPEALAESNNCFNLDQVQCEDNTLCLKWGAHCYAGRADVPEGYKLERYSDWACRDYNGEVKAGKGQNFWDYNERSCSFKLVKD